jgi:hypothetical protein
MNATEPQMQQQPMQQHMKGYCSFVLQDDCEPNQAVTRFTERYLGHSQLPILKRMAMNDNSSNIDNNKANIDNNIFVANPYWMFVGRNTSNETMEGRPLHTDSIQHNGTFHYQLVGRKTWNLRPTKELRERCCAQLALSNPVTLRDSYTHTVNPGDTIFINTKLWWHQTQIPGINVDDDNDIGVSNDNNDTDVTTALSSSSPPSSSSSNDNLGLSISFARDVYLDGSQPANVDDEYMSVIDGAFAVTFIPKDTLMPALVTDLPETMGRTRDPLLANCRMVTMTQAQQEEQQALQKEVDDHSDVDNDSDTTTSSTSTGTNDGDGGESNDDNHDHKDEIQKGRAQRTSTATAAATKPNTALEATRDIKEGEFFVLLDANYVHVDIDNKNTDTAAGDTVRVVLPKKKDKV